MSDEPKPDETPAEWSMPEPVFRTTDGRTPKGAAVVDIGNEDTTEPGFHDAPTIKTADLVPSNTEEKPAKGKVKVKAKAAAKPKKKRGCAKSFLMTVGMIALIVIAIAAALIYFFVYYRPADTGTF